MRIYVASSWRNEFQQSVVSILRQVGHEVYDYRNPPHGKGGFHWSEIEPKWLSWTPEEYIAALKHPIAQAGFKSDFDAMQWAETCVLVLPCGRSAHLEAGWFAGAGRPVHVLQLEACEPELMNLLCTEVHDSLGGLINALRQRA